MGLRRTIHAASRGNGLKPAWIVRLRHAFMCVVALFGTQMQPSTLNRHVTPASRSLTRKVDFAILLS
ncbi:MAG: hypothetical protein Q7J77_08545 [Undibacterium sp.]|nr:hypothetical protein [Undibacterium sp.]